jgi:hypothetical protein
MAEAPKVSRSVHNLPLTTYDLMAGLVES